MTLFLGAAACTSIALPLMVDYFINMESKDILNKYAKLDTKSFQFFGNVTTTHGDGEVVFYSLRSTTKQLVTTTSHTYQKVGDDSGFSVPHTSSRIEEVHLGTTHHFTRGLIFDNPVFDTNVDEEMIFQVHPDAIVKVNYDHKDSELLNHIVTTTSKLIGPTSLYIYGRSKGKYVNVDWVSTTSPVGIALQYRDSITRTHQICGAIAVGLLSLVFYKRAFFLNF